MSLPLQIAIGLVVVLAAMLLAVHLFHEAPPPIPRPLPPRATPARQPEDQRVQHKAGPAAVLWAAGAGTILASRPNPGSAAAAGVNPPATHALRFKDGRLEKVTLAELHREEEEIRANQRKLLL